MQVGQIAVRGWVVRGFLDVPTKCRQSEVGSTEPGVQDTQCCFAEKTETWVSSPEGARWEWYVKNADSEQFENVVLETADGSGNTCCS